MQLKRREVERGDAQVLHRGQIAQGPNGHGVEFGTVSRGPLRERHDIYIFRSICECNEEE